MNRGRRGAGNVYHVGSLVSTPHQPLSIYLLAGVFCCAPFVPNCMAWRVTCLLQVNTGLAPGQHGSADPHYIVCVVMVTQNQGGGMTLASTLDGAIHGSFHLGHVRENSCDITQMSPELQALSRMAIGGGAPLARFLARPRLGQNRMNVQRSLLGSQLGAGGCRCRVTCNNACGCRRNNIACSRRCGCQQDNSPCICNNPNNHANGGTGTGTGQSRVPRRQHQSQRRRRTARAAPTAEEEGEGERSEESEEWLED